MSGCLMNEQGRSAPRSFWPLVCMLAAMAAVKPLLFDTLDPDLFWHILVGQQLAHDGVGPLVDCISYASMRDAWTPYSWLAEMGMNLLWRAGGFRAVLAAHGALAAGVILFTALAALQCARASRSGRYASALIATGAAMMLILPWYGFRPAAMAICLLAAVLYLLYRDRQLGERWKGVWLVPPLTALIVNLHLYALMAPIWVGALMGGAILEWFCAHDEDMKTESSRRARRYLILLLLTFLGCCCTPMLRGFVRTALYYQFADPMVVSALIVEMQPFYEGSFGKIVVLLLIVVALVLAQFRRQIRAGDWLMLAAGAALLVQHGRFTPLFGLCLVPALVSAVSSVSDQRLDLRFLATAGRLGVASAFIALLFAFPRPSMGLDQWVNRRGRAIAGYPCGAADYAARNIAPRTGKMINEFTWGGYLAWRLHDHFQVLVDGRTQVYSGQFWNATYLGDEHRRENFLATIDADMAILPAEKSLFRGSLERLHWRPVYCDSRAVILLPPAVPGDTASTGTN